VPIYKIHGSLNWQLMGDTFDMFQDHRLAFKGGGQCAIIPPMREKEVPTWLRPIWESAAAELEQSIVSIICGYSMPEYDEAVRVMILKPTLGNADKTVIILDPNSESISRAFPAGVRVVALDGLPAGTDQLDVVLRELRS
jgi:hypothetical protein